MSTHLYAYVAQERIDALMREAQHQRARKTTNTVRPIEAGLPHDGDGRVPAECHRFSMPVVREIPRWVASGALDSGTW